MFASVGRLTLPPGEITVEFWSWRPIFHMPGCYCTTSIFQFWVSENEEKDQ